MSVLAVGGTSGILGVLFVGGGVLGIVLRALARMMQLAEDEREIAVDLRR